jgi:hypothetical protein
VNKMAEGVMKMSSLSEEQVSSNPPAWANKEKHGSVIPVKRRSVLGMIFITKSVPKSMDLLVQPQSLSSSTVKQSNKANCCFQKSKGMAN